MMTDPLVDDGSLQCKELTTKSEKPISIPQKLQKYLSLQHAFVPSLQILYLQEFAENQLVKITHMHLRWYLVHSPVTKMVVWEIDRREVTVDQ